MKKHNALAIVAAISSMTLGAYAIELGDATRTTELVEPGDSVTLYSEGGTPTVSTQLVDKAYVDDVGSAATVLSTNTVFVDWVIGQSNVGSPETTNELGWLNDTFDSILYYMCDSGGEKTDGLDPLHVISPTTWGVEMSLGTDLARRDSEQICIAKCYGSGSSLIVDWADGGHMWDNFTNSVARVNTLLAAEGYTTIKHRAVYVMQGEADVSQTASYLYYDNATNLMSRVNTLFDMPEPIKWTWGRIHDRIDETGGMTPGRSLTRDSQVKLARDFVNVKTINTDDFTLQTDDLVHFVETDIIELGHRFADITYPDLGTSCVADTGPVSAFVDSGSIVVIDEAIAPAVPSSDHLIWYNTASANYGAATGFTDSGVTVVDYNPTNNASEYIDYDGTNQLSATSANFNLSYNTELTCAFWVKLDGNSLPLGLGKVLEMESPSLAGHWSMCVGNNKRVAVYYKTAAATTQIPLNPAANFGLATNTWTHVAWVYDPADDVSKAYVNGLLCYDGSGVDYMVTDTNTTSRALKTGFSSNNTFAGGLDEIFVYDIADETLPMKLYERGVYLHKN